MVAIVFPGQGSQYQGMGSDLFDSFSELIEKSDSFLGYSLKDLCLSNPEGKLDKTEFTQPALYVVNAMMFLRYQESHSCPSFLAGHSLGEYNALLAANVFDFETGLKIVQKRGQLMGKLKNGSMAAIIGISASRLEKLIQDGNFNNIDIANYNSPKQSVISGLDEEILEFLKLVEREAEKCVKLAVSGAFHSRQMEFIRIEFQNYLSRFDFDFPRVPVISNLNALPYDKNFVLEKLSYQLVSPVRWVDIVKYISRKNEKEFIEIGPGHILSKLISQIADVEYAFGEKIVVIH